MRVVFLAQCGAFDGNRTHAWLYCIYFHCLILAVSLASNNTECVDKTKQELMTCFDELKSNLAQKPVDQELNTFMCKYVNSKTLYFRQNHVFLYNQKIRFTSHES